MNVAAFRAAVGRAASGCWPWTMARNASGYGRVRWKGRDERAHRVAWEVARGPIPAGICVLHHCDNPPCCNPDHLFLGTKADNARDCVAKGRNTARLYPGRSVAGVRRWAAEHPERHARGESVGTAKLTVEAVREMRRRLAAGESERAVARAFGVSKSQGHNIASGRSWPEVQP